MSPHTRVPGDLHTVIFTHAVVSSESEMAAMETLIIRAEDGQSHVDRSQNSPIGPNLIEISVSFKLCDARSIRSLCLMF